MDWLTLSLIGSIISFTALAIVALKPRLKRLVKKTKNHIDDELVGAAIDIAEIIPTARPRSPNDDTK